MPPEKTGDGVFLVGEPLSHLNNGEGVFDCYVYVGGRYFHKPQTVARWRPEAFKEEIRRVFNLPDPLAEQVLLFREMADKLEIEKYQTNKTGLRRMFIKLTEEDAKNISPLGDTILRVEIEKADGTTARASLVIAYSEIEGWKASVVCQTRETDPSKTLPMKFVEWQSVGGD